VAPWRPAVNGQHSPSPRHRCVHRLRVASDSGAGGWPACAARRRVARRAGHDTAAVPPRRAAAAAGAHRSPPARGAAAPTASRRCVSPDSENKGSNCLERRSLGTTCQGDDPGTHDAFVVGRTHLYSSAVASIANPTPHRWCHAWPLPDTAVPSVVVLCAGRASEERLASRVQGGDGAPERAVAQSPAEQPVLLSRRWPVVCVRLAVHRKVKSIGVPFCHPMAKSISIGRSFRHILYHIGILRAKSAENDKKDSYSHPLCQKRGPIERRVTGVSRTRYSVRELRTMQGDHLCWKVLCDRAGAPLVTIVGSVSISKRLRGQEN